MGPTLCGVHARSSKRAPRRPARSGRVVIERNRRFSQSVLWDWQRRYFAARGIAAWSEHEVPHFVTSNVMLARAYAEIVFASWRDGQRVFGATDEPLTVLELGAGCGRLAFHFLTELRALCEGQGVSPACFRYVLSDQSGANFDFWRTHPQFRAFFDAGMLDLAICDIAEPGRLWLEVAGATLAPGSLTQHLVVIANYVFDSVSQDLYFVDQGSCRPCEVELSFPGPPPSDPGEWLRRVEIDYSQQPVDPRQATEPWLQTLLDGYAEALDRTHLLVPTVALRCLHWLFACSPRGLLLLSADKGDHRLSDLAGKPAPGLVRHGSFSLSVNYHAIKTRCERLGGLTLFPSHRHDSLDVNACLFLAGAERYADTQVAYRREVAEFGPDDFYSVIVHARRHVAEMTVRDVLGYLRLSRHDPQEFMRYLPRLKQLAPDLNERERDAVRAAIAQVWGRFFPIGEELNVANEIAVLLCEMDDWEEGLCYFEHSLSTRGEVPEVLGNLAICLQVLGREAEAMALSARARSSASFRAGSSTVSTYDQTSDWQVWAAAEAGYI